LLYFLRDILVTSYSALSRVAAVCILIEMISYARTHKDFSRSELTSDDKLCEEITSTMLECGIERNSCIMLRALFWDSHRRLHIDPFRKNIGLDETVVIIDIRDIYSCEPVLSQAAECTSEPVFLDIALETEVAFKIFVMLHLLEADVKPSQLSDSISNLNSLEEVSETLKPFVKKLEDKLKAKENFETNHDLPRIELFI